MFTIDSEVTMKFSNCHFLQEPAPDFNDLIAVTFHICDDDEKPLAEGILVMNPTLYD